MGKNKHFKETYESWNKKTEHKKLFLWKICLEQQFAMSTTNRGVLSILYILGAQKHFG